MTERKSADGRSLTRPSRAGADAAQWLLRTAAPARHTVTEIATGGGLNHLGRFSVEYRRTFGKSPLETLRS